MDLVTISAPCPSWSTASSSAGLWKEEGQLFVHSILKCRFFRPEYIAMENVAGFCSHDHKGIIEKALRWIGYRLTWQRVWDIKDLLGVTRSRWTAVAKRVHGEAQLPTLTRSVFPTTRPIDHACCLIDWNDECIRPLLITPQMASVASDPRKATRRADQLQPPNVVLQSRMFATTHQLPTFLAQYGSQHELNDQFLNRHGYLGFFHQQAGLPFGGRLFHPAEVALLHGVVNQLFVLDDMKLSWRITGNCITMLHAMLPLLNVVNAFLPTSISSEDVLTRFVELRLFSDAKITKTQRGTFFTLPDQVPSQGFLDSLAEFETLHESTCDMRAWIPGQGCVAVYQMYPIDIPHAQATQEVCASAISVPSSPSSIVHSTMPFAASLPAKLILDEFSHTFWFSSDLPAACVEMPWNHVYECVFPDEADTHACTMLKPRSLPFSDDNKLPQNVIQILLDDQLTLYTVSHSTPLLAHDTIVQVAPVVHDQFGVLNIHQTADEHTLLIDRPLQHGTLCLASPHTVLTLLAALDLVDLRESWNPRNDSFELTIHGQPDAVRMVADFWLHALHPDTLSHFGRTTHVAPEAHGVMLAFPPAKAHGVVPPQAFRVALAIGAFRALIQQAVAEFPDASVRPFVLKWLARPVWEGQIPTQFTAGLIIKFLYHAMFPVNGHVPHRLICNAKQVMPDSPIADMPLSERRQAILFHAVLQLKGGGQGAKNQQRILQQTALASYLLEHGFELPWISQATEAILQKFSLAKLQAITAMPAGNAKLTSIMTLCREADIKVPEVVKPTSRKDTPGLPWNKPKKRRGGDALDPNEFTLVESFFKNQDGTPCVAIPLVRPQTTGVCLMNTSQAAQWLQTEEKLSSDELAILVLGPRPETKLPCTELSVPCHNLDGQMVLLKCFMFQLGVKDVVHQKGDPQQVDAAKCVLMALTLYRPDFTQDQWNEATQATLPFIRKLLAAEGLGDAVLSMWGRSFRADKAPCTPLQAKTIQIHCSVGLDHVPKFLARSGFNHIFCTPKQSSGRLSSDYRILWLQGDAQQIAVASAKVPSCLGMVRGQKTLGLRFKDADFDKAWDVLCPQMPRPHKLQGDLMFKAEGLPFGTTFDMMQQWAQKIGWQCQPVRTLGPQAMLLRSDSHPPAGVLMFNASPILVRFLPPKPAANTALLVGPRATKAKPQSMDSGDIGDPWAAYKGPRPTPPAAMPVRSADGPTESRLAAQDQKLQAIEAQIQTLTKTQDAFVKQTDARFQAAEEREKTQLLQVSKSMEGIKHDLDRALHTAFQKNTAVMEERMAELKHLLGAQNKRPPPDEGGMTD